MVSHVFLYTSLDEKPQKVALNKLSFKKEAVLQACQKLFADPDPCIIYQTYAINYLAHNFGEYLAQAGNSPILVENLPIYIREAVDFPKGVCYVQAA